MIRQSFLKTLKTTYPPQTVLLSLSSYGIREKSTIIDKTAKVVHDINLKTGKNLAEGIEKAEDVTKSTISSSPGDINLKAGRTLADGLEAAENITNKVKEGASGLFDATAAKAEEAKGKLDKKTPDSAEELKNAAGKKWEDAKYTAGKKTEEWKDEAGKKKREVKDQFDETKDDLKDAAVDGAQKAQGFAEDVKESAEKKYRN